MHHAMVAGLALIGRSPSYYTRLRPIQPFHIEESAQNGGALGGVQTSDHTCSAQDYYVTFSMTSYKRRQKGVTTNLYGGTDNMAGFVLHWLFNDYYFLMQLFATSLKMAVNNRVESSSALPPYQSPRLHDSKNTTLHIPAFDSIYCHLLQGRCNSFTI